MQEKAELKAALCQDIDARLEEASAIADHIMRNPELGFKEFKTARLVDEKFSALDIPHRTELAITGVKGIIDTGRPGPTVAVLGELDSLLVPDHPFADPLTGAAHACGHNIQIAMLLTVAAALRATRAADSLSGRIVLFAVPAEEAVEVEYRMGLTKKGKLEFLGGKTELIAKGEFDDVDIAMMTHTTARPEERTMALINSNNGCLIKQMQFIGKASHAGGMPEAGINALNAAMVAMVAMHAQRETFKDRDTVRLHPIITKGGDLVNIVPADVRMETFVRAKTPKAIEDADAKLNRALRAGAISVGGKVKVITAPGYMPYLNDKALAAVFKQNALTLMDASDFVEGGHRTGSTDMGDVSQIMPAIHAYANGCQGTSHGNDYLPRDYNMACLNPSKVMAMTVVDLLYGDAAGGKELLANHKPAMARGDYLKFLRKMNSEVIYE